jgi:two-component system sensor histidine kinase QseC
MMRRWWAAVAEPSLMRRLILAQMALLGLLWVLAVAFLANDASFDTTLLRQDKTFNAFLTVASAEADDPARLAASMSALDEALRESYGNESDAGLAPQFIIERGGRQLFRTRGVPAGVRANARGGLVLQEAGGKHWRTRTVTAPGGALSMTMIMPADRSNVFITLNSRGYVLLPLLISLPFLIVPAWLSIRLALRPWRKVAAEVASRGPQDLRPLSYRARHREMRGMVDGINALMRRVGDSAQRERAFIADAAHELRTPLAAMRVNVEALQGQTGDARQRQLLDGILSSGARATRLVSQLLRLMRSDATAEEAVPLAFDELVQERMAVLSGIGHARGVELELGGDNGLHVIGRREGLVSLVDNLLDNAIKYSPDRGTVHADLRREDGRVVLRIADQGPGIAPELRERVFDRFFRDPRQTQSGSGLGLAIARAVAEQHGGEISLDAVDGGAGLLVTVRLPLRD